MKKFFLSLLLTQILLPLMALPGVDFFIPDNPGEFIYYEDFSFNRKSYIGFLTYDENTFAARYFAPATKDEPYKNIELLFTIDSSKDYIDMTGERFITPLLPEDTEIVNYIHDLIYEFGSRRKKAGEISARVQNDPSLNSNVKYFDSSNFIESGFVKAETFNQFGGEVLVYYDYLSPIFNIKKIESNSRKPLFVAIASGILRSSEDRSFSDFSVVKESNNKTVHNLKNKVSKPVKVELEKTSITLDQNWAQAGNIKNVFFCGDTAFLRTELISEQLFYIYVKTALLSTNKLYTPYEKISFVRSDNRFTIYATNQTGENDYKVITSIMLKNDKLEKGENSLIVLTASTNDYLKNQKYFAKLLKSWK